MPRCVRPHVVRRATILTIAAFLGSLLTLPVGATQVPHGPSVPFTTVLAGTTSEITEPTTVVVRDKAAWVALWRRHTGARRDAPPAVDFAHEMVMAVFGGASTEPTTAGIVRITREPNRLVVWYGVQATRPLPPGDLGTVRSPFHIVKLPRSTLPVIFFFLKTPEILRQQP
jgi:hypothetical protein